MYLTTYNMFSALTLQVTYDHKVDHKADHRADPRAGLGLTL